MIIISSSYEQGNNKFYKDGNSNIYSIVINYSGDHLNPIENVKVLVRVGTKPVLTKIFSDSQGAKYEVGRSGQAYALNPSTNLYQKILNFDKNSGKPVFNKGVELRL